MNRPEAAYAEHTAQAQTDADELARADFYALIARLLLRAPDATLLTALAGADSLAAGQAGNPLELAWEKLILAAGVIDADAVREEFDALFISIGTPQVNPYASLYLAGFMMEKPLAGLRADLAQLGLSRAAGSGELEDHLGALCEAMRILIAGAPGVTPQPLAVQMTFFEKHIATWYLPCLDHIRGAPGANFYQRVADFIQAFFEIEAEAFTMDEACSLK
ncbi:molecular chaperone TorD family protein [Noviherbaspirillum sp.]|jgi:TorA maturation chaperone TorD|uniref:TorD/DmsD family molecular chaperone n=1 Tax=Noviherbaspirillum sp. TaxID=1926288 RepID=UPI0025D9D6C0|nr:molecular chaperone TorD family protein [Noviherbaspirillum sp.]